MTSTTDAPQPTDDSAVTEPPQPQPSRLNQASAWVGIVAGGLFIVAAIFFSGFFLSWSFEGHGHEHMGPGTMACCSEMKPGDHMGQGGMMGPGMMGPGGKMGPASPSPTTTAPSAPRP
jgi:hypothetical protein